MKRCTKCSVEQPLGNFSKRLDGLAYVCKTCAAAAAKARYSSLSPERRAKEAARAAELKSANREHYKETNAAWCKANAEHRNTRMRAYYEANRSKWKIDPAKDCARVMKRNAAKLMATPTWADQSEILAVYQIAASARQVGVDCHVDHIVPLRSRLVCGLHVAANLDVVLASENRSKGNRHWPDGPSGTTK